MSLVELAINGGVATVTLAQPPVNALSRPLIDDLASAVADVRADSRVRVAVITGGPKVFAAGGDVKEMVHWDYVDARRGARALGDVCSSLSRLPVPVIAAISGFCLGGGLEVALAADIRIADEKSRLGFPEILLGLIPGAGGTQRLPRLIGASRAKRLMMTGASLRATEALEIGLVDEVVEDVQARAAELAAEFSQGPAMALAALKEAVDRGTEVDLDTGLEIEQSLFTGLFATEDRRVGMTSFLEDGPGKAAFVGR